MDVGEDAASPPSLLLREADSALNAGRKPDVASSTLFARRLQKEDVVQGS